MIGWAVTFLIIALIAGVLGFSGIAGTAANIAWILFVVGLDPGSRNVCRRSTTAAYLAVDVNNVSRRENV